MRHRAAGASVTVRLVVIGVVGALVLLTGTAWFGATASAETTAIGASGRPFLGMGPTQRTGIATLVGIATLLVFAGMRVVRGTRT